MSLLGVFNFVSRFVDAFVDLVPDPVDADAVQFVVEALTDHVLVLDQLVVLPLVFVPQLHLFLAQTASAAQPVPHPQS